jgi:hypothetical protein
MTKLIAGYDRAFARQFFFRSVNGMLDREEFQLILPEEVEYLADRFSETAVISRSAFVTRPFRGTVRELLQLSGQYDNDRRLLQHAEIMANSLLFSRGFTAFGGPLNLKEVEREEEDVSLTNIRGLYRNAARGRWRKDQETFTLRQISRSAKTWISLLGWIPGNDLLELVAARQTFLELP